MKTRYVFFLMFNLLLLNCGKKEHLASDDTNNPQFKPNTGHFG